VKKEEERRDSQVIMTRENERKERRGTQPSHDERRGEKRNTEHPMTKEEESKERRDSLVIMTREEERKEKRGTQASSDERRGRKRHTTLP
jgi:hypothetical protein